jgi:hypothetical protein
MLYCSGRSRWRGSVGCRRSEGVVVVVTVVVVVAIVVREEKVRFCP